MCIERTVKLNPATPTRYCGRGSPQLLKDRQLLLFVDPLPVVVERDHAAERGVLQHDGHADLGCLGAQRPQDFGVPIDDLPVGKKLRRLVDMRVHHRGPDPVRHVQCLPKLTEARLPDAGERRGQRQVVRRVGHDAEAVGIQCHTDCRYVDLVRIGCRWFQGQVYKIEAVLPNPVDLCHRITGRMVHCADLHGGSITHLCPTVAPCTPSV